MNLQDSFFFLQAVIRWISLVWRTDPNARAYAKVVNPT